MLNIKNILCLAAFFAISTAEAQTGKDKKIEGGEVGVVATYKATLLESEKIKTDFSLPRIDTSVKSQNYDLSTRNFKVEYQPPKLRPIAMAGDKNAAMKDAKNGYVKLGYGVPSAIFGDVSYAFTKDKLQAIAQVNHYNIKSKSIPTMRYANTGGRVSGNYYLSKNYAVGGYVGYNQESPHYYALGQNPKDEKSMQKFKLFDLGASIFNTGIENSFTYGAAMDIYRLGDDFSGKENGLKLEGKATKWFADKHPLTVVLKGDFSSASTIGSDSKEALNNLYVQPSFTFHGKAFYITAGANLASNDDEWTPFPMVEASVNALGDRLAIFGGWKGDLKKNTYRSLTDYCPFLNYRISTLLPSRFRLLNTEYQDYYGGAKGHFGKVEYNVQGGYKPTTNMAVFVNDVSKQDTTTLHVDYADANITYVKGTLAAELFKGFELSATVGQNIYAMKDSTVAKPWHLPSTDITTMVKYRTMENRLMLKGQVFFQNGVSYFNTNTNSADNLEALIDLSVGAEFNINKTFGLWLDVNNVLNNQRQRWARYPSFGINVLGGLKVKF